MIMITTVIITIIFLITIIAFMKDSSPALGADAPVTSAAAWDFGASPWALKRRAQRAIGL